MPLWKPHGKCVSNIQWYFQTPWKPKGPKKISLLGGLKPVWKLYETLKISICSHPPPSLARLISSWVPQWPAAHRTRKDAQQTSPDLSSNLNLCYAYTPKSLAFQISTQKKGRPKMLQMYLYVCVCVCVFICFSTIIYSICIQKWNRYIYIESTHVKNPLGRNLLPEGTESLRIEPMRESRIAESQTNSFKFNSLYKESNRNRQNRIGTTLSM